ncbi:MAG: hypothetical protein ABJA79_07695 [Parafilimonas sp.]
MNWVHTMNVIAVVALFLPVAVIIVQRLSLYKTFPILLFYYSFAFFFNLLLLGYFNTISDTTQSYLAVTNNLLDGPLVLSFFTYLCYTKKQKQLLQRLVAGLLVLCIVGVAIEGYNDDGSRIVLGPSVAFILFFSFKFFNHYTKLIIRKPNVTGKTIMAASLIFCYIIYAIIYILFYVFKIRPLEDTLLIYFLATIFGAGAMAVGVFYEGKKVRRIKEVQVMRKEMAALYAEDGKIPRKRNRVPDELFGFDPSQVIPGFRN